MNHPVGIQPLEQFILRLASVPSAIACLQRAVIASASASIEENADNPNPL